MFDNAFGQICIRVLYSYFMCRFLYMFVKSPAMQGILLVWELSFFNQQIYNFLPWLNAGEILVVNAFFLL